VVIPEGLLTSEQANSPFNGKQKDISDSLPSEQTWLELQETALSLATSGVGITDLQGCLTYVNTAFLEIWHYSHEQELLGLSLLDLCQETIALGRHLQQVRQQGQWRGELVGKRQDGTKFNAQVFIRVIKNRSQAPFCFLVSVIDITRQKNAEVSLNRLLNHYTILAQSAPVGILRTDTRGNLSYANEKACGLLGYNGTDTRQSWLHWLDPRDRQRILKQLARAIASQSPLNSEYRYRYADGRVVWVMLQFIPERDDSGKIMGYLGILLDITEGKIAQKDLNTANAQMKANFQAFPDVLVRSNAVGKVLDLRSRDPAKFFLSHRQGISQNLQDIFPTAIGEQIYQLSQRVIKHKSVETLEYAFSKNNQLEYFEARLAPLPNRESLIILRRITERKRTEIELRESEERLLTIIQTNADGLVVIDKNGQVLFINPAGEKLFGRRADVLLGEKVGIPIVTGESTEIQILHPTQGLKTIQMRLSEIPWEGNRAYLAALTDITNLKEAQEKVKILSRASEQSPAMILITDAQGSIEYVNAKFEQITGYTLGEVRGKNPRILQSGETERQVYRHLWETITSGQEWRGELSNKKKNGEIYWQQLLISSIKDDEDQITHFLAIQEDITERKKNEALLAYQANYDSLTHLPNRVLALEKLCQAIRKAQLERTLVALMFVDLDHFKDVNDTLGHEYGDQLLQIVARRLQNCLRKSDTVARLGGDEFLIIVTDLTQQTEAQAIAEKVLVVLESSFSLQGEEVCISASIGITIYPSDGAEPSLLMRNADTAMYRAKHSGRNGFQFYTHGMNEASQQRVTLESHLRHALPNHELSIYYQPLVELTTVKILGVEALMRWHHPKLGHISPNQFIPVAEQTGLITSLGAWILNQACLDIMQLQRQGFPLWIAVNLSPRQFRDSQFLEIIAHAINNSGINTEYLELEITEDLLIEKISGAENLINSLHSQKIRLILDDFGTGYSSLSYLRKYHFNGLKIDRSFIADIPNNAEAVSIVRTILAMAQGLGLKSIAEGVET
jgi:diguanylate cyclase (GGDEF)-like protein/PAS domain S-box-containing protein